ncbi:FtsW/RodA/SpoVE family cell cycle protein [Sediminibacillus halophilus]|uniref:Cell division protein FtsW, lipid II flippase n=1 Tax=Sediminibacillus halophilus TaxID=482461 RepID=A0A1G9PHK4_9BACI|nr:FtsW/RodA/SpoVE family cell cycle protein [Sediminibacillus halophilus]SDL97687.1 cell division protein FtsW, lipid II flippase [Sediminibacillus halophilus]
MNSNNNSSIDYTLIFIVLLLGIVSCFTLYSVQPYLGSEAQDNYFIKQIAWYVAGGLVVGGIMWIDYDRFRHISWYLYGAGMVTLLMLFFQFPPQIIHTANNATSWFIFPGIGTIQPAEFFKVFLVIALAHVMVSHNEKFKNRTNKSDLWLIAKIAIVSLPPMGLIAVQPDLGGFLVLAAIVACMVLVSGIRWRVLSAVTLLGLLIIGAAIGLSIMYPDTVGTTLEESVFKHVESRFYGWLDPEKYTESGYQLKKAMLAIGSGQLTGKGMRDFEVDVPERQTDMIFTAIAEQYGFIGASIVVTLLFLLIYRLIYIALQSNDEFGSFIITGLIGMFAFQIFQNIGMSVQLLPITGLPLPFLSYGGSSTLTYMIAIGLALNIRSRTKQYMFD